MDQWSCAISFQAVIPDCSCFTLQRGSQDLLSYTTRRALPWRAIAGMRDVLIHAYDQIDLEEVWLAYQRFSEIKSLIVGILEQN